MGSVRPSAWEGRHLCSGEHLDCPQPPATILVDDVERAIIIGIEPGFEPDDIYVNTQYLYTLEFYGAEEWAREVRG